MTDGGLAPCFRRVTPDCPESCGIPPTLPSLVDRGISEVYCPTQYNCPGTTMWEQTKVEEREEMPRHTKTSFPRCGLRASHVLSAKLQHCLLLGATYVDRCSFFSAVRMDWDDCGVYWHSDTDLQRWSARAARTCSVTQPVSQVRREWFDAISTAGLEWRLHLGTSYRRRTSRHSSQKPRCLIYHD